MLVGGWDPVEGPQLFDVNHGTKISRKIAWNGSGSYVIIGYIDKNFKEDMSKAEAFEFLKEAISLATYRDGSSGGSIRIMDITKDGRTRHYIPHTDKVLR
uniref:proteasome endopeptidase complex n=1 Tax=Euplotes harpa TaxID=151035 RepID=A0A7S3JLA7_9SPIT|mmetsp:Transcript_7781/g.8810  ORF Transcript_7781/g.8810 Transcript_7781/m.8810 type:complete len:100 (+) Transcript_7781:322-621(+)